MLIFRKIFRTYEMNDPQPKYSNPQGKKKDSDTDRSSTETTQTTHFKYWQEYSNYRFQQRQRARPNFMPNAIISFMYKGDKVKLRIISFILQRQRM